MLPESKIPEFQRFVKWKIKLVCSTGPSPSAQGQDKHRVVLELLLSGPFLQTVKEEENRALTEVDCMEMLNKQHLRCTCPCKCFSSFGYCSWFWKGTCI